MPERRSADPGTRDDRAARSMAASRGSGDEPHRIRDSDRASNAAMSDPDAWHDLAERGTPRNG
jgi:hypothetical protein